MSAAEQTTALSALLENGIFIATILSTFLESGTIIVCGVIVYRALKQNIDGLKGTISAQKETLELMDSRIENTKEVANLYKNLILDLPKILAEYKNVVGELKVDVVATIDGLNATISAQNKTLDVIDRRADEEKKLGEVYKNFIAEVPATMDSYKKMLEGMKKDLFCELEKANKMKDEELKKLYEMRKKRLVNLTN